MQTVVTTAPTRQPEALQPGMAAVIVLPSDAMTPTAPAGKIARPLACIACVSQQLPWAGTEALGGWQLCPRSHSSR